MFIKNRFALPLIGCALILATALQAQCPQSRQSGIHIVQKGETLYRISLKHKVSIAQLCEWNNLREKDRLEVCQTLLTSAPQKAAAKPVLYEDKDPEPQPIQLETPNEKSMSDTVSVYIDVEYREPQRQDGSYHRVMAGETLEDIADLYGYTDTYFRKMNGLSPDEEVEEGHILRTSNCTCNAVSADFRFVPDGGELTYKRVKTAQVRAVSLKQ